MKINVDDPQAVIKEAYRRGWFWNPDTPNGNNVQYSHLAMLTLSSPVVRDALITGSKFQYPEYIPAVEHRHDRLVPHFDGELGPAMQDMLLVDRCAVPDFIPPDGHGFDKFEDEGLEQVIEQMKFNQENKGEARGSGNWEGCHNVGEFHSAIVDVDLANLPSQMKEDAPDGGTVLQAVFRAVQKAYAETGLLFRFRNGGNDMLTGEVIDGKVDTRLSYVPWSSGWIGLATVVSGQHCSSSPEWLKLLRTYRPGDYIRQWFTLTSHELGHNCGSGHRSGDPVMHPSIRQNSPWVFDPRSSFGRWLDGQFGGEPVDIPGGDPPTPPPTPNDPIQEQIDRINHRLDVHTLLLADLLRSARFFS